MHKDLKYQKIPRQTILNWWISERGVASNAHLIIHIGFSLTLGNTKSSKQSCRQYFPASLIIGVHGKWDAVCREL
jgi:hypothetical protein